MVFFLSRNLFIYALESYCVSLGIIIDIVFSIHIKELMTRELFIIIFSFLLFLHVTYICIVVLIYTVERY